MRLSIIPILYVVIGAAVGVRGDNGVRDGGCNHDNCLRGNLRFAAQLKDFCTKSI